MKFRYTDSLIKRIADTIGLPLYTFRKYAQSRSKNVSPVVGIPWYSEKNWHKMKALAEDKERFHATYQQWLASADKSTVLLTNRVKLFEHLSIDPIHYAWWCNKKSLKKYKASRIAYTQYLLRQKIKQLN